MLELHQAAVEQRRNTLRLASNKNPQHQNGLIRDLGVEQEQRHVAATAAGSVYRSQLVEEAGYA